MEFIGNNTIKLDKEINELDRLVLSFIRILEKHTKYVIVSGYVSILLGRSRSTEDVDIYILPISEEKFVDLYKELEENGFWCINSDNPKEMHEYLRDKLAVRFAISGQITPNFEVRFPKKDLDFEALNDTLTVTTSEGDLVISSLERQIAFKRFYLGSDKDTEDAEFIEKLFKGKIDSRKIDEYAKRIRLEKT